MIFMFTENFLKKECVERVLHYYVIYYIRFTGAMFVCPHVFVMYLLRMPSGEACASRSSDVTFYAKYAGVVFLLLCST